MADVNPGWSNDDPPGDGFVSFVPLAAVEEESGRLDPSQRRTWDSVRSGFSRFENGDVLFAKITPCMENGKFAVASDLHHGRAAGSTEFHVLRPYGGVNSKFLLFYLLRRSFRADARRAMKGAAGQLRVATSFLSDSMFPLLPLNEQQRIVEVIEEQFTRLDAAVAGLQRVQQQLKRYRASVLKAACEGRLVPTEAELARAEGREYEPADRLLARILDGRRAIRQRELIEPVRIGLTELPTGWAWATVDQLSQVETGATPLRTRRDYYDGGTVPWVTSGAVNRLFVDQPTEFITDLAIQETNAKVLPVGTLIVAMYGEGKTRGKVSELRIDAATNQACAGMVFSGAAAATKPYIKLFFESNYLKLRALAAGGAQPNLNLSIIRQTAVPLPPLAEQERIVAEVERRLSVVEKAEAAVEANLKRADRMRQAILKRAFEGKLVPQDPNDEPASVLLERIRAERERAAAVNGRGKRGRKLPGQLELPGLPSPPDPLSRARERGGRIGR